MDTELRISECLELLKKHYTLYFINNGSRVYITNYKKKIRIFSEQFSYSLSYEEFEKEYGNCIFYVVEKEEDVYELPYYEEYYSWKQ